MCEKERETTEGVRRKEGTECCEKKVEATERGLYVYMFLNGEGNRKCEKKGRQLKV